VARTPGGLSLPGFLRIASRKWERHLTIHRSAQFMRGIIELHLTGTAPGGFPMQIMQVDACLFLQWCYSALVWGGKNISWGITPEQIEEAKNILQALESSAQSEL